MLIYHPYDKENFINAVVMNDMELMIRKFVFISLYVLEWSGSSWIAGLKAWLVVLWFWLIVCVITFLFEININCGIIVLSFLHSIIAVYVD